jgi:monoamine oxidase
MENEYFKPEYDCIIIGSALAGMTAAITLRKKGFKNILILERQNMPGGVTTSFVRSGVELAASLHEMSSVSSEECPLSVRQF